jgi:hypothetical protein
VGVRLRLNDEGKTAMIYDTTSGSYIYDYTTKKYLGINIDGLPYYHDGSSQRTLIHSGNIGEQTVNKANGITWNISEGIDAGGDITILNDFFENNVYFKIARYKGLVGAGLKNSDGLIVNWPLTQKYGQQWFIDDETHTIQTRRVANNSWSDWKTIAFTDSNVESATKLQTARTIWGHSFDGTQNLYGAIFMGATQDTLYNVMQVTSNLNLTIGLDTAKAGKTTLISGNKITFRYGTTPTAGMQINENGNVGIGTTNPSYALDIYRENKGDLLHLQSNTSYSCVLYRPASSIFWSVGANDNNRFYWWNSAKSSGVASIEEDGSFVLLQPSGAANAKTAYISAGTGYSPLSGKYGVKILCCDQTDAQTGLGQDCFGAAYELSLITTRNGSNGRIAFGYHYVNETTYTCLGYFHINGFNVNGNISASGAITATGNITTDGRFYDSSDIRLKNIISDLSDLSLDTILSIPRVRYQWKKDNSITMIGTIAQPLIGKFDELLHKDSEGVYSVDYDSIGVIALEGVAKVKSEVDILRERITELEDKVKMLGGTI